LFIYLFNYITVYAMDASYNYFIYEFMLMFFFIYLIDYSGHSNFIAVHGVDLTREHVFCSQKKET